MSLMSVKIKIEEEGPSEFNNDHLFLQPINDVLKPFAENIYEKSSSIKQEPSNCTPVALEPDFVKQEAEYVLPLEITDESTCRRLIKPEDILQSSENSICTPVLLEHIWVNQETEEILALGNTDESARIGLEQDEIPHSSENIVIPGDCTPVALGCIWIKQEPENIIPLENSDGPKRIQERSNITFLSENTVILGNGDKDYTKEGDHSQINKPIPQINQVNDERYICDDCGKLSNRQFKLHLYGGVVYSKEKPFKCDKCEKFFETAELLYNHKVTHYAICVPQYLRGLNPFCEKKTQCNLLLDNFMDKVKTKEKSTTCQPQTRVKSVQTICTAKSNEKSTQCYIKTLHGDSQKFDKISTKLTENPELKVSLLKSISIQCNIQIDLRSQTGKCFYSKSTQVNPNVKHEHKSFNTDRTVDYFYCEELAPTSKEVLHRCLNLIKNYYGELTYKVKKLFRGEIAIAIFADQLCGLVGDDFEPLFLVVTESGKCTFNVAFTKPEIFNLVLDNKLNEDLLKVQLEKLRLYTSSNVNKYNFCPGLTRDRFQLLEKSGQVKLVWFNYPTERYQSKKCQFLTLNCTSRSNVLVKRCKACNIFIQNTRASLKRKKDVTLSTRIKRICLDSHYPISKSSPHNRKTRMNRATIAREYLQRKLSNLPKKNYGQRNNIK